MASFGGRKTFIPENDPRREGINDLELFHRKPSGWMGSDKVFDSDGDIIDYQVAIVEYANGVGDELPHQPQRARPVPPLRRHRRRAAWRRAISSAAIFDVPRAC